MGPVVRTGGLSSSVRSTYVAGGMKAGRLRSTWLLGTLGAGLGASLESLRLNGALPENVTFR